jgi:hypothetical protein
MKTLLVADESGREKHVGEEFDEFIQVDIVPEADSIDAWADRIRQTIRRLWHEDTSTQKGVSVFLDAAAVHYSVVIEHLQSTMLREEKIKFLLVGA